MSIGQRIKQAREQKNLTQNQLAALLGVTKGSVGNYESEVSSPKEPILYKLFEVLEVDANFLFQDEMKTTATDKASILSNEALEIAVLFDKADDRDKETVRHVLGRYKGVEIAEESQPDIREKAI